MPLDFRTASDQQRIDGRTPTSVASIGHQGQTVAGVQWVRRARHQHNAIGRRCLRLAARNDAIGTSKHGARTGDIEPLYFRIDEHCDSARRALRC